MKKFAVLMCVIAFMIDIAECACGNVPIDNEHFPDSAFRKYVYREFDTNKDHVLDETEIESVTGISIEGHLKDNYDGFYIAKVKSLEGIEYFTALTSLSCSYNALTELDLSNNTSLEYLFCAHNQLVALDLSNNKDLKVLNCNFNRLTALDLSNNLALTSLYCSYNYIAKLDLSKNINFDQDSTFNRVNINGFAEIISPNVYNSSHWISGLKITSIAPPYGNDGYSWYQINFNDYLTGVNIEEIREFTFEAIEGTTFNGAIYERVRLGTKAMGENDYYLHIPSGLFYLFHIDGYNFDGVAKF